MKTPKVGIDFGLVSTTVGTAPPTGKGEKRFLLKCGPASALVSSFGATVLELHLPDAQGKVEDCVMGFDTMAEYDRGQAENPYIGSTVGPVANRIGKGQIIVEGKKIQLPHNQFPPNGDPHTLHGGPYDMHRKLWDSAVVENGVQFTLVKKDGEGSWPATVRFGCTYTLTANGHAFDLNIKLTAELLDKNEKKSIPVCLSNHSYFNLDGHNFKKGLEDHYMQIYADAYTEVDPCSIVHGNLINLDKDPAMDWRKPKQVLQCLKELRKSRKYPQKKFDDIVKKRIHDVFGVDVNYCLRYTAGSVKQHTREVARIYGSKGRYMSIQTDQMGVQCYTGNYIDHIPGKKKSTYTQWQAICMETQTYPNAISVDPNNPGYKTGECFVLKPGGPSYSHQLTYSFGVMPKKNMTAEIKWRQKEQSIFFKKSAKKAATPKKTAKAQPVKSASKKIQKEKKK